MARKIAKDVVRNGFAPECEIQIAYAIGMSEPVSINVNTFDLHTKEPDEIVEWIEDNYDLTPKGIIRGLGLLDVNYNLVSAYGHFGKPDLPWEE